jgi:hypothetical protein
MQQFPFIDLFKSALQNWGDIFAQPQKQFNCMYSFCTGVTGRQQVGAL